MYVPAATFFKLQMKTQKILTWSNHSLKLNLPFIDAGRSLNHATATLRVGNEAPTCSENNVRSTKINHEVFRNHMNR
jgi:hypothetical protein